MKKTTFVSTCSMVFTSLHADNGPQNIEDNNILLQTTDMPNMVIQTNALSTWVYAPQGTARWLDNNSKNRVPAIQQQGILDGSIFNISYAEFPSLELAQQGMYYETENPNFKQGTWSDASFQNVGDESFFVDEENKTVIIVRNQTTCFSVRLLKGNSQVRKQNVEKIVKIILEKIEQGLHVIIPDKNTKLPPSSIYRSPLVDSGINGLKILQTHNYFWLYEDDHGVECVAPAILHTVLINDCVFTIQYATFASAEQARQGRAEFKKFPILTEGVWDGALQQNIGDQSWHHTKSNFSLLYVITKNSSFYIQCENENYKDKKNISERIALALVEQSGHVIMSDENPPPHTQPAP